MYRKRAIGASNFVKTLFFNLKPLPAATDEPPSSSESDPSDRPCVLVAPLNWGLGHATRCIPLIRAMNAMGARVILASDGDALRLLKAEFPHLTACELPSYRIRYASNNMVRNIAGQLPRILYAIRAEHRMCRYLTKKYRIQGIVSDNRYGCFNQKTNSVILTHQLNLRIPNRFLQWLTNTLLKRALQKFEAVWVPDGRQSPHLSGELSHPSPSSLPVYYIGPLSRMRRNNAVAVTDYDVAVVLSGPEPQRTILEQRLIEQALSMQDVHFIFIQGKTKTKEHHFLADHLEMVSYLTSGELNEVLLKSKAIVCRSGYSSLMDLAALGKKALLIPTPGQTEQEYLADYFAAQGIMPMQRQKEIDLEKGLQALEASTGFGEAAGKTTFEPILQNWLDRVKSINSM